MSSDDLTNAVAQINIFPGNILEYQRFVGYPIKIIDTGASDKGVLLVKDDYRNRDEPFHFADKALGRRMVSQGIEAIINVSYSGYLTREEVYGLPVCKAQITDPEGPYR